MLYPPSNLKIKKNTSYLIYSIKPRGWKELKLENLASMFINISILYPGFNL